jgi:hypothetical protein
MIPTGIRISLYSIIINMLKNIIQNVSADSGSGSSRSSGGGGGSVCCEGSSHGGDIGSISSNKSGYHHYFVFEWQKYFQVSDCGY